MVHESGLPGCEEDAFETSQDGPLEEMGSKARVCGVDGRSVAGADASYAVKEKPAKRGQTSTVM